MSEYIYDSIDRDGRLIYRFTVPSEMLNSEEYWHSLIFGIRKFFDSLQPGLDVASKPITEIHIAFHVTAVSAKVGDLLYDSDGNMVWISKFVTRKSFTRSDSNYENIKLFATKTFTRFHRDLKVFYEMNGIPTRF